jgi:D-alanine-D-alanine ligase-like ATP-grasp enzyme
MLYRMLCITSDFYLGGTIPTAELKKQIALLTSLGLNVELLIDPSEIILEKKILSNYYDCIYTATMHSYELRSNSIKAHNYNIIKCLEYFQRNFIGSDFFTQLLINDKTLSGKRSGIALPSWTITRELFEENNEIVRFMVNENDFPLIVKPNTLSSSLGIDHDSVVDDYSELIAQLIRIFARFDSLTEIIIEQFLSNAKEFTVSVLGNKGAICSSVTELKATISDRHIYSEIDKKSPLNERSLRYEITNDGQILVELIFHAQRLFEWFGMRDIGRFDFLYDKRAYLIDINALPVPGNSFSWQWQQKYAIKKDLVLALMLAAFHYRQISSGCPDSLPNEVLKSIPHELLNQIKNPSAILVVPESTVPSAHCDKVHLYTMSDRVSAETEMLQFLKALVILLKPDFILETGTYKGSTALAMVDGLLANKFGNLVTLEIDASVVKALKPQFSQYPVEILAVNSLDYYPSKEIDILFLDSHRASSR